MERQQFLLPCRRSKRLLTALHFYDWRKSCIPPLLKENLVVIRVKTNIKIIWKHLAHQILKKELKSKYFIRKNKTKIFLKQQIFCFLKKQNCLAMHE